MTGARAKSQGRVLLFTGEGKGKTTAAFGVALRLAGHGRRVLIVQFAKGGFESGERRALSKLSDLITVKPLGGDPLDLKARPRRACDLAQVRDAWTETLRLLQAQACDAVILDEIVFVVSHGFLPAEQVAAFLDERPPGLTVVMTGRGDVPELVERADTVTEMKKIRHPFDEGREALPGIEY